MRTKKVIGKAINDKPGVSYLHSKLIEKNIHTGIQIEVLFFSIIHFYMEKIFFSWTHTHARTHIRHGKLVLGLKIVEWKTKF